MFDRAMKLRSPGVFITATDTEIGKTTVACGVAASLRGRGQRVGVCKPIATGCRFDVSRLVAEDAEALAHYSDCRQSLDVINPVRYREALAPWVAAERSSRAVHTGSIYDSMHRIDEACDVVVVEGIGGVMVPIAEGVTVLDMAAAIGYPVVVVTRGDLGTLNHTAMTCELIKRRGLRLAGLVINRYKTDTADVAESTNPYYLAKQNGTKVLATVPEASGGVEPHKARMADGVLEALDMTDWMGVCKRAKSG